MVFIVCPQCGYAKHIYCVSIPFRGKDGLHLSCQRLRTSHYLSFNPLSRKRWSSSGLVHGRGDGEGNLVSIPFRGKDGLHQNGTMPLEEIKSSFNPLSRKRWSSSVGICRQIRFSSGYSHHCYYTPNPAFNSIRFLKS